ncbi:MAG TPA: sulfotransferase [Pseudomonadales bacterium]
MSDGSKRAPLPGWVPATLERAFADLNAGRPEAAADACRRILAAAPELVQAHFLVGLTALAMNDRRTAVSAFGSVTKLAPEHGAAWAQLARLFVGAGQVNRADHALAQAIRHAGDDPQVHDLIGVTCSLLGDQEAARAWYAKAVARAPDQPGFRVNLANALVFLGRTAEAEAELGEALRQRPDNAQAHWLLAGVRRARDRRHVEQLVRLLASGNHGAQGQAFLYYALGKELEDLEEWPRAFEAFARGAAARRSTLTFDEALEQAFYDALEQTFTAEWLERDAAARACFAGAPVPIFVIGQPRTGTTLVERVISAHSEVHSAGELQQLGLSLRRLVDYRGRERFAPELALQAADVDAAALGRAYLAATERQRGTRRCFVDKLPSNFLFVPLILKALPHAKIVHLVRDPMDACFASFKQLFADAYPHSYEQGEMARHFARYHRLMAVWRERFPGRFLDVRYEDIVADLEPHARRLIDYLELPWEDRCLEFHRQSGSVATASAVQVREPAHTRSVGRWRRYEQQLAPMRAALAAAGVAL